MTYQADQSNDLTIKDIIPDNLNENLLDSLVGYETIIAYNQSLRLTPFIKLDNKEFRRYGEQAIETINYWMKNVETPFNGIFLSIKNVFFDEETVVVEISNFIDNLINNSSNVNKNTVQQAIDYYLEKIEESQTSIVDTNKHVNEFRITLANDSINFNTIADKLPGLQGHYKKEIDEKQKSLEKVQAEIDRLTVDIRKKTLKIQKIEDDIGKAGICCAIPLVNLGGAIAMASFLSKKASANKELKALQDNLAMNREKYQSINRELLGLNEQLPLLATVSKQVPSLWKLSQKSAEVAQAIKTAWDQISDNLIKLKKSVNNFKNAESFVSYKQGRLMADFNARKIILQKTLNEHKRSNLLGLPYDDEAKRRFQARSTTPINYVDVEYKREGLFYFPYKSLVSLT